MYKKERMWNCSTAKCLVMGESNISQEHMETINLSEGTSVTMRILRIKIACKMCWFYSGSWLISSFYLAAFAALHNALIHPSPFFLCVGSGLLTACRNKSIGDVAIKKRQVVPEGKGSTRNKKFQSWITVSIPKCWASLLLSASISWRSWVWLSSHQTRSQPLPPPPHSTLSVRFPTFMATCNTQNRNWKLNNGPPILLIANRGWRIICRPHY